MKVIMKNAVDHVYKLLWLREKKPQEYEARSNLGSLTRHHGTTLMATLLRSGTVCVDLRSRGDRY